MRNDAEQFRPLGPATPKPAPAAQPEWKPTSTPGIDINQQGQLRHTPPPEPFSPYYGSPRSWGHAIDSLRRAAGR